MSFNFEYRFSRSSPASGSGEGPPMRILLLGDFSGAGIRRENAATLRKRTAVAIDLDNFDEVLARFAPQLRPAVEEPATVHFESLDDFHPDALYRRLAVFRELRSLRERLHDPQTFAAAAAEFRGLGVPASSSASIGGDDAPGTAPEDAALLQRLLGAGRGAERHASNTRSSGTTGGIDELIRRVVAPHIAAEAPPFQTQYVAAVDAATADQMRRVLHDRQFQALESLWRAVFWLVSNLELGANLQIHLLDASKADLARDLEPSEENASGSALFRLVADRGGLASDEEAWSLLGGLYEFGSEASDFQLLARLGEVASHAGAPFLAGAAPDLVGCDSLAATPDSDDWALPMPCAEQWAALRTSRVAPWLALTIPRVLLRLPYGKKTDPVEQFDFEELASNPRHHDLVWGNGAVVCALLLARAYMRNGWDMVPGDELDVADLPALTYTHDGEQKLMPCAEANLTERAGEALLNAGLIPILSYRNRNAVRVMRFQSLARPPQPLAGAWAQN